MPWLPRLAAGAAVALAVGVALMLAAGPQAFAVGSGVGTGEPAPPSGHSHHVDHHIDPVSAGLLVADGITVLAVVALLLRRPRRSAPDRR